ncbi:aminotransferase class I/II-fold pyridoxal phosphate-dependent enzyme [Prolixibacter sp. SD074]|uniref:aminotransferase class I/II-fold pyridoxal phosphate-dependent enzyme n=1 Tax=Prolixibacter sp. SD074 TaxID=2652391 RepID=UPI00127AD903|nr:aminotransferase class I/II-fold pyridoxal phosphate-dependent enzyme [Prolixibacter sp. SD074]GET29376.1 8-amino-7-oxononanoate synthase [Prolixibacter sp. SD074]
MDIFEKIKTNKGNIGQYKKEAHGYFSFPKLEGEIGPKMKFRGKEVLNWSLNNYIGLANHPEVRKADAEAAAQYGMAYPMGARMMSGQTSKHEELEKELADFVGKPDAFLLNYGYQGMVSTIDAIVGRNDVVVYDAESHACILDGVRLHMGKRFVYLHNDMDSLRKQLEHATSLAQKTGGGILVITEGVFGMSGDMGRLDDIVALKKEHSFRLLVDDAHGFGTMGKTGAGSGEELGVQDEIDMYFGTFAKSMAGIGAFIACTEEVCDYLRYNMRSQTFAKSLPMPMVIGALKRLELLRTQPELREQLWTIVNALQNGLKEENFDLGVTNSPVTPVYLSGSVAEGTNVVMDLRENYNIFCSIVVYPVIPKGQLLLRLIPTASHTIEDVEYTIKAFSEVRKKLESGKYSTTKMAQIS